MKILKQKCYGTNNCNADEQIDAKITPNSLIYNISNETPCQDINYFGCGD